MKDEKDEGIEFVIPGGPGERARPGSRKMMYRNECVRCGECCSIGSPVLLRDDLSLFEAGVLNDQNTYTVREGEMVRSRRDNDLYESAMELVKIREREGAGGCVFYEPDVGCAIYEQRPAQCRAYKCWSSDEMITGLKYTALKRVDLFGPAEVLLQVIARHDEKCSYGRLAAAIERTADDDETAVEEILDMLQYDTYARPFLEERFGFPLGGTDLLLGRPLTETIREFGLDVVKEADGYVLRRAAVSSGSEEPR